MDFARENMDLLLSYNRKQVALANVCGCIILNIRESQVDDGGRNVPLAQINRTRAESQQIVALDYSRAYNTLFFIKVVYN